MIASARNPLMILSASDTMTLEANVAASTFLTGLRERGRQRVRRVAGRAAEHEDHDRCRDGRCDQRHDDVEHEEPRRGRAHPERADAIAPDEGAGDVDERERDAHGSGEERPTDVAHDADQRAPPRPEEDRHDGRADHVEERRQPERGVDRAADDVQRSTDRDERDDVGERDPR